MFLASKFEANIRELEGSLRASAPSPLLPPQTDHRRVRPGSAEGSRPGPRLAGHRRERQQVISAQFAVKMADLKSPKRTRSLAFARQVAMYLSRKLARASLPAIGEKFGRIIRR
jgi:chromosomal replication initiator protein